MCLLINILLLIISIITHYLPCMWMVITLNEHYHDQVDK